jgi:hypothetical protein
MMSVRHRIDHLWTAKSCSDSDRSSLPPPLMGLSWEILKNISECPDLENDANTLTCRAH